MIPKLTNGGENLILRAMNGETITFTAIAMGNGECPANYASLTSLMNQQVKIGLETCTLETEGYIKLKSVLQNNILDASFIWTEVGIFAEDLDGGDDVLYAYCHYELDTPDGQSAPSLIPKASSSVVEMEIEYDIFVGEAENISAALAASAVYATQQDLQQHTSDTSNPHSVTKTQVGLGNVPNVSTNNQIPTWSLPGALADLISGEKLSVAFGKIAKAISSLISHIQDTTSHITSAERTAWNNKAAATHNHSAANITSGVLSVGRGGTGSSSPLAAAAALNVLPIWGYDSTKQIRQNANLNNYKICGRYYCRDWTIASTLSNTPVQSSGFWLIIFGENETNFWQILLTAADAGSPEIYYRTYSGEAEEAGEEEPEEAAEEGVLEPQEVSGDTGFTKWRKINVTSLNV